MTVDDMENEYYYIISNLLNLYYEVLESIKTGLIIDNFNVNNIPFRKVKTIKRRK